MQYQTPNIDQIYQYFLQCAGVSTDTRQIKTDSLFFALKGDNFNGNQFAQQALNKGAKFAVIDEVEFNTSGQFLVVANVLKTLQELANFHRNQLNIPFLAITGTNGKTTTKELVNAVLSTKFNTKATQGNLNNHIGVPLTLLEINPQTEIAIIEMGANHVGDIRELCNIAEPNLGLITNVGLAHLEGFGSFDGVLRAKSELYDHLLKREGITFVNRSNAILATMGKRLERKDDTKVVYYGVKDSFLDLKMLNASPYIIYQSQKGKKIETKLLGDYNFDNILSALCVGKYFGVAMDKAHEAIANYSPTNNRSQVIKGEHNTLILDAYNANPSSMKAALENFDKMPAEHKVVILGDMFELGSYAREKHLEIVQIVQEMKFDKIIFCGKEFYEAHKNTTEQVANLDLYFFENKDKLKEYLQDNPLKNSYLLIKGSRGMGLESLVEILK
jgi:UDP-N-acetylmuramoyl-tripeptide--D-alanyl-D-alanine ligase